MAVDPEYPYLPACFELEEALREQLSNRPGHQRCVVGEHELLLVVHEVPKPGVPERDPVFFWHPADGAWIDAAGKEGLRELTRLLKRFEVAIDGLEESLDVASTAAEVFGLARAAGPLARTARNLAQAIEQARVHDDDNRDLIACRDRAREIERASYQLNHESRLTLEFWQAEQSEAQRESARGLNRIAFRLNLLAGFFLPLVALGALFGMNVKLPDFTKGLFWGIFAGGLLMGGVLLWFVGRGVDDGRRDDED